MPIPVRRQLTRVSDLQLVNSFPVPTARRYDLSWSVPRLMNAIIWLDIDVMMVMRLQLSSLLAYMTMLLGIGTQLLFVPRPLKILVGVARTSRLVPFTTPSAI